MPYNTRRKSLSLPSLGIHIPVTHAARAAAAHAPATSRSSPSNCSGEANGLAHSSPILSQSKRLKRSHNQGSRGGKASSSPITPQSTEDTKPDYGHTPPPSPKTKPLVNSLQDEVVQAVISQLHSTGNQPHLVKELAAILSQRLPVVRQSANPCAIVSSRLSTYLKRPEWSGLAPCPLSKELEAVHPRRTYFFLTALPRQDYIPLPRSVARQHSFACPSVTSDADSDLRQHLSPSPEVDLSPTALGCAYDEYDVSRSPAASIAASLRRERRSRGVSPPLEKDEREFTQTANGLQKRKFGVEVPLPDMGQVAGAEDNLKEESLFDENRGALLGFPTYMYAPMVQSPPIKPSFGHCGLRRDVECDNWSTLGGLLDWDQGAENIALDELDCLLETF